MDEIEENGQFRMAADDDIEETMIPSSVDELRLEKISTRVTIISIMIPVLIVIVLVIAYLDIKKRVVQTEDTGSMSVQNLSKDLESRFSSLSLRQARLEEQMASFIDRSDQIMTRIEIKLKGLAEKDQTLSGTLATKKALSTSLSGLDKKLGNLAKGIEDAQEQLSTSAEQLRVEIENQKTDLVKLKAGIAGLDPRLEKISEKMAQVEEEKMGKAEMDLALSLEALRIKQALKTPIDELNKKISLLEKQVKVLETKASAPPPPSPAPVVKPQSTVQRPKPATQASGSAIEEKPIAQ
jgi:uncharacterized protein YoxC